MAREFGWGCVNRAKWAVKVLEAHGQVKVDPGVVRGLRVLDLPLDQPGLRFKAQLADANRLLERARDLVPSSSRLFKDITAHLRRTDLYAF